MRRIFAVSFVLIFVMFTVCCARPYDGLEDKPQIIIEVIEFVFREPNGDRTVMEVGGPPPRE